MEEKYFKVTWKDGKIEYLQGISIADALVRAGHDPYNSSIIDEWSVEAGGLPTKYQEIIILHYDGSLKHKLLYNQGGVFGDSIRNEVIERAPDIDGDLIRIVAFNRIYKYFITISPFQIVCKIIPE